MIVSNQYFISSGSFNGSDNKVTRNFNENSITCHSSTCVLMHQDVVHIKPQLEIFFSILERKMTVLNKNQIIEFLIDQNLGIEEIVDSFIFANKAISSKFLKNFKIFVQKYDDPETNDHFISIDIRKSSYPDDFIDKIWEIRDSFKEYFTNNDWMLITTDYKPLME